MRVAIVERDEKVLEELKKGLKRVDPNYPDRLPALPVENLHPLL